MGLDNGFRRKDCKIIKEVNDKYNYGEIAYWRNCFNIRREILDVLRTSDNDEDEYEYKVIYEQLIEIIYRLKVLKKDKNIETKSEYIQLKWSIKQLKKLKKYIKKNPQIMNEIIFYDSY